ncbi:MAG: TetR/AcrR family transcriptional regulator [Bacteroidetes bacterium]|nr:TetR/AcrR family transcriptional regulator [Bacteroidota bacterium]
MDKHLDSTKYQDILKTAHDLFWKHGIRRVTIEEVCREAGVSKMTFYRYFSNKEELARVVLEKLFDESVEKYRALMKEDISFEEKVKRQLMAKFEGTKEISAELIKDIYSDKKSGLSEYWEKRAHEFTEEVLRDYAEAQRAGLIRKDINLNFILYFNQKAAEMIMDPNMAALYETTQDLIMEVANLFFYGIFTRHNKQNE